MKRFSVTISVVLAALSFAHRSDAQSPSSVPLELFINGPGRVSPLFAGQMLEVWGTYNMEAIPDAGFAFQSWEWVDVLIRRTLVPDGAGGFVTNFQKSVSSKNQFFTRPELTFYARPVFVYDPSDPLTTVSGYGWRANFGPIREPVEPDIYQTIPGAIALERGDFVPHQSRVVPIGATLTFDYSSTPPSLTARIPNAVLEGSEPFPLTVRSYSGSQLTDSTYRFSGDYLRETYPTGSQYLFDWKFSAPTNGQVVWNGNVEWSGAHIWELSISNVILVAQAQLTLRLAGTTAIQVSWKTNFSDHVLEGASKFPAQEWTIVTNAPTTTANRYSVTLPLDAPQRFYRLRKLF